MSKTTARGKGRSNPHGSHIESDKSTLAAWGRAKRVKDVIPHSVINLSPPKHAPCYRCTQVPKQANKLQFDEFGWRCVSIKACEARRKSAIREGLIKEE